MNDKIQLKRGTLENWLNADPILADGEMALVATNPATPNVYDQYKVGGGSKKFSELPYQGLPCLQELGDSTTSPLSQKAITDWINKGFQFRGIATPSTNPGTPDGPVFYIADEPGIYPNFSSITISTDETAILVWKNGDTWKKEVSGFVSSSYLRDEIARLDGIYKEIIDTEDDSISIEDVNGNEVLHLDENGLDAKNVKSNGKDVLTEHQDISGLATKEDVEDSKIKEISSEIIHEDILEDVMIVATDSGKTVTEMRAETVSGDDEECQSWNSDDYDGKGNGEQYAKIMPDGFIAKSLKYKDKNGEFHDVESEITRIDSKATSVEGGSFNGSFSDREVIKQKAAYWIDNPEQNESYEDWSYLEKKIAEVPKGRSFIFVTDTHLSYDSKKSNLLINYVKNRLGIKKGIFGGDSVGGWDSKYKAVKELSEYADEFTSVFGDNAIYCQGNHDGNLVGFVSANDSSANYTDYLIDDNEIYKRTTGKCDKYAHFDYEAIASIDELPYTEEVKEQLRYFMKYSYYVDDVEAKIRYIVIDTGIGSSIQYRLLHSGYGSSMSLFYKTFCKFLRTVPDGYDVVVAGHMIAYYDTCFELIMSAFKAGAAKVIFEKKYEWKSVLGKPIFICEDDLNVNTDDSITDVFLKENYKVYATYNKINGIWTKGTGRFKATIYSSIEELRTKDVNPKVGDYTYIGSEVPYTKCVCNTDSIWEVTNETISDFQIIYGNTSILLNHFVGDNNNAVIETGFDKPFNNKIFSVSGHWHFDAATYSMSDNDVTDTVNATLYTDKNNYSENPQLTNDAVLNIIFDTDSYNLGGTIEGVDSVSYKHTAGTTTESSFCVVTIEEDNSLTITNFGSGKNRKFNI